MLSLRQKAKECCMMDMILHENVIDFNSLERKIYEYGCSVACDVLKDCFQKLDTMLMKSRDKAIYRHKGHRKTCIKTLMGEVEFSRAVYEVIGDENSKKFIYLLDETLKFDTIGLISTNLAEKIVENACITSFKNTAKNISTLTGQKISHTGAWNVTQRLGEKVAEQEKAMVNLYKSNKLHGVKEVKLLFEESDGGVVNLQGKDRKAKGKNVEMKVAISYEGWKNVGRDRFELDCKNAVCGIDTTTDFMNKKEAHIASIYNTDEIEMRIFNSDGAKWIKNLHADDTVQFQLDPFHVRQAVIRKVTDKNARAQINKFLDELKIDEMLEYIDAVANSIDDEKQEKKLRELHGYFTENKNGLIPYTKRGLKLPKVADGLVCRGMGTCEHNVDLVAARRMKHHGASWSIAGANNLGKLLALKTSKTLTETIRKISQIILPETMTTDIIEILSSAKAPKKDGYGNEFRNCSRPFVNASMTNGRKAILKMLEWQEAWDLVIR